MRLGIENGRIRWDGEWTPAYIDLTEDDVKRIVQESHLFSTDPDLLLAEVGIINHRVSSLWIQAGNLAEAASEAADKLTELEQRIEAERKPSEEIDS